MDMMIETSTATLLVAYVVSVVLCVLLYLRCVALECEVDVVKESKDDLRESMSNTNRDLQQKLERLKREKREQRKKLTAEIHTLRTQLHQLRKEQQKQDNQIHKAMTKEQKEVLTAWYKKLLVTYRIDFFRGVVLVRVVTYLCDGGSQRLMRAIGTCQVAERLGFEADTKDYTELLRELREVAKEVPLSDTAQSAITYVFGGDWGEAHEAIFKLKCERFGHK